MITVRHAERAPYRTEEIGITQALAHQVMLAIRLTEALSNTLKYARARNFRTRLISNPKELRLELRDDGDGFQVKERHDGVGLTGMR